MIMKNGTPKSLIQAIKNSFDEFENVKTFISPDECMKAHIKDFLAQRFQVAMWKNDKKTEKMLKELFDSITK